MIYEDENKAYRLDCSAAVWSSDIWHTEKDKVCGKLRDVDWIIEGNDFLYLVEYKNANLPGAAKPEAFQPTKEPILTRLVEKYLDSLPFLSVMGLSKPRKYVCILEYRHADSMSRKMIRNHLKDKLFYLQQQPYAKNTLIEAVDVVDIEGWNQHAEYGRFPLTPVNPAQ